MQPSLIQFGTWYSKPNNKAGSYEIVLNISYVMLNRIVDHQNCGLILILRKKCQCFSVYINYYVTRNK